MSSTVWDSSFSAERPVSKVTPRRITGVRSGVKRIGQPEASTRVPGAVPGHLSFVSSTPSPSESATLVHPTASTEVDAVGCTRVADSDGDGVDDTKDKCPGTAPGTRVDASGCPILFTPERTPVILRGVTFETGRSALKLESHTVLDIVAQSLLDNPDIRIEIAGYTDSTGAPATNLRLSQARAAAVRAYLAGRGVAPGRMVARGDGAAKPIAPNTTLHGRGQNRRVELHQLPQAHRRAGAVYE